MINTLLGTKKNMTSSYDARGRRVGVTILQVLPNFITQIKTMDGKDGYMAIQLGYGSKKSVNKPQIGHAKKAGLDQKIRWFREVRVQDTGDRQQLENLNPGQQISISDIFSVGDAVKVTATSKGKGFQGGVRRHGFAGGPKTHGQSDRHRAPGSIGSGTTPGRVYKGKRMAGHMGVETVSIRNLEIVGIDRVSNLMTIKGAVPGAIGGLVTIAKLGRIKGYTPPPEEKIEEEDETADQSIGGSTGQEPGEAENRSTDQPDKAEKKEQQNAES